MPTKTTKKKSSARRKSSKKELSSAFTAVAIEKADLPYTTRDTREITQVFVSSDVNTNIKDALKFRRQNELVGSLIDTKLDFTVAGFHNLYGGDDKAKTFYEDILYDHEIESIVTELADDLFTTNNAILHWKIDEKSGNIEYVMTLDPAYVEYYNAFGQERMFLVMDSSVQKSLLKASEEQKGHVPAKYLNAPTNGKVELKNEDGEYWLVLTTARKFRGLAQPSMTSIFADLKLREMFIAGDWSVAYFAKAFIQLVKSGESVPSGQYAGTKRLYQSAEENAALNAALKDVSRAIRLVTNHTVAIEQIVPPTEAYSQDKYGHVEKRILRWGGVPLVIIEGSGGNYASGFLGKVKMFADIKRTRRMLIQLMERFYRHPTINAKEYTAPSARFDEQILKDGKELLNELKLLLQHATGFSMRSVLELLGHDPDTEWNRKESELKKKDILFPQFEPNQGMLEEGGRPAGEGATPSNDVSGKRGARTTSQRKDASKGSPAKKGSRNED